MRTQLQLVVGGWRESRREGVALALQSVKNSGSVANWVRQAQSTKHGMINCRCGCDLPNCR